MKISDIKSIDYWAQEYWFPLFSITHKGHLVFKNDCLIFYKNKIIYLYLINDRQFKDAQKGYNYFKKKRAFKKYVRQAEWVVKKLSKFSSNYKNIKFDNFSLKELDNLLADFINLLNLWSRIYSKTEAIRLQKFEGENNKKITAGLAQVGKARFKLKKVGLQTFLFMLKKIMVEIARRFKIKFNALYFYNYDELKKLLRENKKIDSKVLAERKNGYLLWRMQGKEEFLTGGKFKKMWRWANSQFTKSGKKILTGTVANKGKAKGKVRLVLHKKENLLKEVTNFKRGEILVTEMTRPDTILACKKASAIITDEGGITSHAAIVSRELNKPCIIGTKIATRVLKDGQRVEVDANKGVVRIIK